MKVMMHHPQCRQFDVAKLYSCLVAVGVQRGPADAYLGARDQLHDGLTIDQRLAAPVLGDEAEGLMLDLASVDSARQDLWTKDVYNSAGQLTDAYQTDGAADYNASGTSATFAQATTITDDIVLNQQDMTYDLDGNVLETINKDRFNTDAISGSSVYGALGDKGGTGGPAARVSYVFDYYDAADRATEQDDYGTN
jgi:hypothetical protein